MNTIITGFLKYFEKNNRVFLIQTGSLSVGLLTVILSFPPENSEGLLPALTISVLLLSVLSMMIIAIFNAGFYRSRRAEFQDQMRAGAGFRSIVIQILLENTALVIFSAILALTLADLTFRMTHAADGISLEMWLQHKNAIPIILSWCALALALVSVPAFALKVRKPGVISIKLSPFAVSVIIVLTLMLASYNFYLITLIKNGDAEGSVLPFATAFFLLLPALNGIMTFILFETIWNKRWIVAAIASCSKREISRIVFKAANIFMISLLPMAIAGINHMISIIIAAFVYGLTIMLIRLAIVLMTRKHKRQRR